MGESPKTKIRCFSCSVRRTVLGIVIEWVGDSITSMSTISWSASKQNVGKDEVYASACDQIFFKLRHWEVAALGKKTGKLERRLLKQIRKSQIRQSQMDWARFAKLDGWAFFGKGEDGRMLAIHLKFA